MTYSNYSTKSKLIWIIYISLKAFICLDCNFDVDICKWRNDEFSDFSWTREIGETNSSYTGPDSDHTTGAGHYICIETSVPREYGERARLLSPVQAPGPACLIFWYNMYGQNIGSLNVYMKTVTLKEIILFSRNQDIGRILWLKAVVGISPTVNFQIVIEGMVGDGPKGFIIKIVIEGIVGDGPKGDIAIDDIRLTSGSCPAGCSFDDGLCNWKQDQMDAFDWKLENGPTKTINTGPLSDHNLRNMFGYYMYIDTSHPRVYGEEARLVSPIQLEGQYCLTFWYNMFGQHVNKLSVYVKTETCKETLIFSKENGTTDMNWIKAELSFRTFHEFKIIIEGVCGNGVEGDIAIDDISVKRNECYSESAVEILASCRTQIYQIATKSTSLLTDIETTPAPERGTNTLSSLGSKTTTKPTTSVQSTVPRYNNTISWNENVTTSSMYLNASHESKGISGNITSSISKIVSTSTIPFTLKTSNTLKTTSRTGTTNVSKPTTAITTNSISTELIGNVNSTTTLTMEEDLTIKTETTPKTTITTTIDNISKTRNAKSTAEKGITATNNFKTTTLTTTTNILSTREMEAVRSTMLSTFLTTKEFITKLQHGANTNETVTLTINSTQRLSTKSDMTTQSADIEVYMFIIPIVAVMVIVLSISFVVWRRKRRKSKFEFNEKSTIAYYRNNHVNHGLTKTNEDACIRNSDNTNAPSEHRLSYRNDYTEVFLQDIPRLDTTDDNCNSFLKNQYVFDDNKHIYNHLESNKGHFIDETYSHTSDLLTLKQNESPNHFDSSFSDDEDSGKKNQRAFSIKLDNDCDGTYNRVQSLYTDNVTDMVSVDDTTSELENTYNTLCSGGPSKRILLQDDYCHINSVKSSELVKESTYPYARVIKQRTVKSKATSDKCEENADYVDVPDKEKDKDKDNESDTVQRLFELEEANDDIENHDYYILEKI